MDASHRDAKPGAVNVYLKKNNSVGTGFFTNDKFPDVEDLNQKYGVDNRKADVMVTNESFQQLNVRDDSDLIDRTEALIKKLAKKDLEIEKLCVLLESLEPIPGLSAESMRKYIDNNIGEGADFRDAKIVALAKKNRNLMVMLNKERTSTDSRGLQIQELTDKILQLEKHGSSASRKDEPQQDSLLLRKEVLSLSKTIDDLKRKQFQAAEENKKLSRALSNEIGDNVTIEQAVEGTWRGRAQQIIMLKAKIKKLLSVADDNATAVPSASSGVSSVARSKRTDVDTRAQEELVDMSQERKHAVESIIEERDSLVKVTQQLEEKVLAHKARIRNLEADASRQKQQIKVVLDVKDGDDELIDALQQEIQRFKVQSKCKVTGASSSSSAPQAAQSADAEAVAADIARLKRLCKSQADQISTQDGVIRSLRSRLA